MPLACYFPRMANLHVKNVPEKLHKRLRRCAPEQESSVREIVLEAISREVERREWLKRLSGRTSTQLSSSVAELLKKERRQRGTGIG
jgi:plasmid stability protein